MQTRLPDWLRTTADELIHGISTKALRDIYQRMGYSYEKTGRFQPMEAEAKDFWLSYMAARMPATFAALSEALRRAPREQLEACQSLFDMGSGPGTSLFAVQQLCPNLNEALLVESDPHAADLFDKLLPKAGLTFQPVFRLGQVGAALLNGSVHDLTVINYTLGELPEKDRATALSSAWEKTRRLLVLVEPGTPAGFRNILMARETLTKENAQIAAPCPHALACPMEALMPPPTDPTKATSSAGKWCHFSQRLERSKAAKIIKGGEYGYEDEKFSYVVFARGMVEPVKSRIVGWPRRHEGTIGLDLCQSSGKLEHFVATRAKKKALAKARRAHWGDEWKVQ